MKTIFPFLSVLILLALGGCGSQHGVVGKWRMAGDGPAVFWEFAKDGSVLIGNERGRYTFGNDDRVKIETRFATSVYQMQLENERMILKDPKGSKLEFIRVKKESP